MVDLRKLDNALQNLLADGAQKTRFWNEKMDDAASQLAIEFRGHSLDIPLSKLDLEHLLEMLDSRCKRPNTACVLKRDEFALKLKTSMSLKALFNGFASLLLAKMFGVSLENLSTAVEIRPDCLVICSPGQLYHSSYNLEKEPGTFGCMFLQLPIEGDDGGCHLQTWNKKEVNHFEFKEDSNTSMYLGAIAGPRTPSGKQGYTLTTAGKVPALMVICNLVWMDSFSTSMTPDQFPSFVHSLHELNQCLTPWKLPEENDNRFLILPLIRNYVKTEFNLSNLKDVDCQLFQSLVSIDYIDVDLAILEEERLDSENDDTSFDGIEKMYHWREKAISDSKIKLHKWNVTDRSFVTCLTVEDSNQVVGPLTSLITTSHSCSVSSGGEKADISYRPVLVIQPKNRRFEKITRNPKDLSIYKYFESRLPDALQQMSLGNDSSRNLILSDITQVTFYFKSTLTDYTKAGWETNLNLFRLLNICGRLKAPEEGLALLDVITRLPLVCEDEEHVYSEVYLPQFNDALADFICLVSGWDQTVEFIDRLVQADDFSRSYTIPCDLGIKLYDRDCLQGAVHITDSILLAIDDDFDVKNQGITWDLVDLTMYVDTDNRTSYDPNRYVKLLNILKRLTCARLPYLMSHVDYSPRLVLDLGKIIVNSSFTELEPWDFIGVIKVCEDLEATDLLLEFWQKTCLQPVEFTEELQGKSLFEVLILTDVLQIKQKAFLIQSMSCCPEVKQRINSSVARFLQLDLKNDTSSISSYFVFIALAENLSTLSDEERIQHFCRVYQSLETSKLCSLVGSLRQINCTDIKEQPASNFMFKSLLQQLLTRDFKALIKFSNDSLIENFRFFSWFGDVELISQFMKKLINIEDNSVEKWKMIISFINKVINDPDVLSINSSILGVLLETWIESIDKMKDFNPDFVGMTSSKCFERFIRAERQSLNQFKVEDMLEELLCSLNPTSQILVLNDTFIREINSKETSMKTFEKSWKIFAELCRSLVNKPLFKSVFFTLQNNQILQLTQSFLWLGEEQPIKELTGLMLKIPVVGSPLSNVTKQVVKATKTLALARLSHPGVLSVNDLIDHCIERLHHKMQPKYSWALTVVYHVQEIEQFMRSEAKRLRFGSYQTEEEAEKSLEKIVLDPSWGVTSKVRMMKSGYKIEFAKSFPFSVAGEYERALKASVDEFKALRRKLLTSVMKSELQCADVSMASVD